MATPTNRTPVRIARGSTSALTTGISDIQEGEIVWDTTTNKLKVKEGVALEESTPTADATKADLASPTFTGTPASTTAAVSTNTTQIATTAFVVAEIADEVGTTVQAYDADTAKLDVDQSWSGAQRGDLVTVTAATTTDFDFSLSNNFYIDMATAAVTTINASSATAGQSGSIIIKGHGSNTLAGWDTVYKFSGGTAPTITADATKYDRIDYIIYDANNIHMVWSGNY